MKKAIVSGATGAIGMALINELTSNHVDVLVLARKSGRWERIPTHPQISLLLCELDELSRLRNNTGTGFDVFFHLAWAGTSGEARNDAALQEKNIRYALDAVALAHRFGCSRFVGVGSQAEYGRVEGPLTPTTPAFPENGYGIAKLASGQLTRIEAARLGLSHVWARVLSVYGPFDSEGALVTSTVRKLLAGERPRFTKGEQLWDLLYSKDAARALRLLGERGQDGAVYPLGSGRARPLKEFIQTIGRIVNPRVPLSFGEIPYAPRQVMHLEADISALTRDTGFVPTTSFEDGVRETAAWATHSHRPL